MKSPSAWFRLAAAVAALTLPLIYLGGRVTSTGSGMAVPDWPTTFGENMFFFPWSKWVGPVAIEHTHRLAAALVGLATIALAIVMAIREDRPRVRWLGCVALAMVIGQGVLGGMRVTLYAHGLAPIHGCVAQAFFAFAVALVALGSRGAREPATIEAPRGLAIATAAACYFQVILGAWYRHTAGARLEPHGFFAVVVLGLVIALARAVKKDPALKPWARALHAFTGVQLLLGLASWRIKPTDVPSDLKVAVVSTHLVFGALVLGTTVAIAVLSFRAARASGEPKAALDAADVVRVTA
jgi:cytochrome c oxidase assembly protein subunit 15